ncbi:MAG: hypothetical protein IJ246_05755 [Clostridia bacterium]|nr:hypothetical protein [Clostridia bacterium]
MIRQSDVDYAEEIIENLFVSDIRRIYADYLLVWVCGSGNGTGHPAGNYYCVLDYKGNTRFIEGEIYGASANAAMIEGFREAVSSVKKPMHMLLLAPCPLGFQTAFRGKGPNAERLQAALEKVKEKGCSLRTSVITGDLIRQFVMAQGGKTQVSRENRYRKMVCDEWVDRVCTLLQENGVDPAVIQKVRQITAE